MSVRSRKFDVTADSLAGIEFFSHLGHAERAQIARYCQGLCYQPGDEIIRHRATDREVYFILAGRVRASLLKESGHTVAFQDLEAGKMFGELSAMDEKSRSTSVIALDEVRLVRIPGKGFHDVLAAFPSLARQVILRLCALSRYLCERVSIEPESVEDRILRQVRRIVRSCPVREDGTAVVEPPPTHEEIAQFAVTRREQVTRAMSRIPKSLIERSRKRWVVHDVDAVCRLAPPD